MRAEWFKNTIPKTGKDYETAQKAAVEKAEALFLHVARTYYDDPHKTHQNPSTPAQGAKKGSLSHTNSWLMNICDFEVSALPAVETSEDQLLAEIRRYFKFEGGRGELSNPLGWYKVCEILLEMDAQSDSPLQQKNAGSFPTIARMARDFLAIPATSVSVERTFSKSRHICTDLRSSLKVETIQKALLSKVWIRDGLLDLKDPVPRQEKHGSVV
jgi:hypothetical protein